MEGIGGDDLPLNGSARRVTRANLRHSEYDDGPDVTRVRPFLCLLCLM